MADKQATPLTPEVLDRMREHVRIVNEAVACRANFPVGSEEYANANLYVCRVVGDAHWIVSGHWKDLIATIDAIYVRLADYEAGVVLLRRVREELYEQGSVVGSEYDGSLATRLANDIDAFLAVLE